MNYKIINHGNFNEIKIQINNFEVDLLDIGATLKSIRYHSHEKTINALLEYEDINAYTDNDIFLGATLGRFAGRIKYDELLFTKDIRNNGNNVLHGGTNTSANKIWSYTINKNSDSIDVIFTYLHKNDGFTGKLDTKVKYTFKENEILVEYDSKPIGESICNITNHAYFTLGEKDVSKLKFKAQNAKVALTNSEQLPTGEYQRIPPESTFLDLDKMYPSTRGIDNPVQFDQKFVIESENGSVEISSSYEFVVLYTQSYESKHKFLNTKEKVKNGVAVELQNLPNKPVKYTKNQSHYIQYKFM